MLAVDASSGELLWRKEVQPPTAATEPLLVGGVAVVASDDVVVAYDGRDGKRLWSLEQAQGPQVSGDLLVVGRPGAVQAVEPRTGRAVWRDVLGPDERVLAGPAGVAVLSERDVRLVGSEGVQRWRVPVAAPAAASPGPEVVAVGGLRGDVLGLAADDGRVLWRTPTSPVSYVLQVRDRVLARLDEGVAALDAATGALLWTSPGGGGGTSAPLEVQGDHVLVVDPGGRSRVLDLRDGRLVEELEGWDVALTSLGRVRADPEGLRLQGPDADWTVAVRTGARPVLWMDADDDVVVAVAGWGQPPTRD